MGNTTPALLFVASIFWIAIASSSALQCYECNLYLCSRDSAKTEQCKLAAEFRKETNETLREKIFNTMESLAGCKENTTSECDACLKVQTIVRRQQVRGTYRYDTILSKMCWTREKLGQHPDLGKDDDKCVKTGPPHAAQTICQCHSDLCNAARSLATSSLMSAITFGLALRLYIY